MKYSNKLLSTGFLALSLCLGTQALAKTPDQSQHTLSKDALTSYQWQLVDAKDAKGQTISTLFTQPNKPLTLNFAKIIGMDVLYLKNTCNNFSAKYSIDNGELSLGHFTATMKACSEPEANFDNAAMKVVDGHYKIIQAYNNDPVLTVTHDGQVARFKAVAK